MIQVSVWLIALVVTASAAGILGIKLAFGRTSHRAAIFAGVCLTLSCCLIAADSLGIAGQLSLDGGYLLLIQGGIVGLAALVILLVGVGCRQLLQSEAAQKRVCVAGLLVCQVAVAGWTSWRFWQQIAAADDLPVLGNVNLVVVPGEALLTEKGSLIPVYRSDIAPDLPRYVETREGGFNNRRIQRAGQDERANCHGWVFAGGQYLLMGQSVELILADNGYQVVAQPQPGDVIVYRDAFNKILHTGLVRVGLEDGAVLIESKWGIDQRYLHLPEDQHYSQFFSYYRRQRPSPLAGSGSPHLVQAVRILPGNLVVSQRPEEALVAMPQSAGALHGGIPAIYLQPGESYPLGAE